MQATLLALVFHVAAPCAVHVVHGLHQQLQEFGVGGAVFLGLSKVVVKGHGNSKANSFAASIAQAATAVRGNLTEKIKAMVDSVDMNAIQAQTQETIAGSEQ